MCVNEIYDKWLYDNVSDIDNSMFDEYCSASSLLDSCIEDISCNSIVISNTITIKSAKTSFIPFIRDDSLGDILS